MTSRRAIVTGAGGGIGGAVVEELIGLGDDVLGLDLDASALADRAAKLGPHGSAVRHEAVDITDDAAVGRAVENFADGGGLDVVIAAHGLNSVDDDAITKLDLAVHQRLLDVNLNGVVHLARHSAPHLLSSTGGVFLAVSSIGAFTAPSGPSYAASKAALNAFMRIMSYQLAPQGVRCLTVCPGSVDTQMMHRALAKRGLTEPGPRPGALPEVAQPSQIAAVIRFLVSDEASYVTGTNVTVDGGSTPF